MDDFTVTFERLTDLGAESPVLIEGFPGFGLVAAIAVDQITTQLGLEHHGNLVADSFPPVLTHQDGQARNPVRVYADAEHNVMTLESDLALPPYTFRPLSDCIHGELADVFDRAIFLAGTPARSEEEVGNVRAVVTDETIEADVRDAGIELAGGTGAIGGITGALATDCYRKEVPAVVLIVHADPYFPDPGAARSVIEDALEPLVAFDIDTTELAEQSNRIQRQMEQIAEQYRQMVEGPPSRQTDAGLTGIQ